MRKLFPWLPVSAIAGPIFAELFMTNKNKVQAHYISTKMFVKFAVDGKRKKMYDNTRKLVEQPLCIKMRNYLV